MSDESLLDLLGSRLKDRKTVVLAIGNPWRGDDGFGPALAKRLQGKIGATVINGEEIPENYLGLIVAAEPETVVLVDSVELGQRPGDVALVEADQLGETGLSTHAASVSLCTQYLQSETRADVFLLGVQPKTTELGLPLSPEVQATVDLLQRILRQVLSGSPSGAQTQP